MHVHAPLDHIAFSNAWRTRSPIDKMIFGGGLLLLASVLPALPWSAAIFAAAATAALAGARIPVRAWGWFLAPQIGFLSAAVLPLILGAGWERAAAVWMRGAAAAACMTLLAMTTPAPDLLLAARRARVPAVLVELAFLVYRLIASIWVLFERLRLGLDLRLRGGKPSLRAATLSASNLLTRSIQTARRVERGASLRGLDGFPMLTPRAETSRMFLVSAVALQGSLLAAAILFRSRFPW
ncbi:MAG: hypothetical protein FJW39_10170 [Acidobacteria bacterium]|nr:hypothetical protein [Acidobacteriota bacterium]